MFSEELEKIDWEETTKTIYSKTESDVLRALGKEHCDVDDFMALISPAAAKYLEPMAQLSKKYTEERFGKTISMFIPLYITNSCTNSCVYCGFHISNPMARTILTPEQIEDEYKAIKKLGPFENLLLVTGENPAKAGVPYLAKALDIAKGLIAPEEPKYYTIAEAMERFNLTRDQLYHYVKYHNIPRIKVGKYTKILRAELDKFFEPPKIE